MTVGRSAYKLALPPTWRTIHPVFNEVVLSPYTPPAYSSQQLPPPPPPVDVQNNIYTVDKILNVKKVRGQLKYLVLWKGYPREQATWEPLSHLEDAKPELDGFYRENPSAIRS